MTHEPATAVRSTRVHLAMLIAGLVALGLSGFRPEGRFNWLMETLPAMAGGALLVATYRRFKFTTLTYTLIWIFCLILMTGGHYTYAKVPIGNWAKDAFGLSRNHFDRMGHFMQGVIPAMVARELLVRTSPLRPGKWLIFICICIALAISASYELFEWRYAVTFGGERAADFLGSQGDIWDAQQDMFQALAGATVSVIGFGWWQDRMLRKMGIDV